MKELKDIKWGCIQPLTGGMYIGAEKAIGHPASWVISYPGLTALHEKKDGSISGVGNEYPLFKWLEKNNKIPPYMLFDKGVFEKADINNVKLVEDPVWSKGTTEEKMKELMQDTDLIVSVPVCSGLSMATTTKNQEVKDARNCNMVFNCEYALGVLKPKVYIFENAPTLYGNSEKAKEVRDMLNALAEKYGYSIGYIKTDTKYHGIPQKRPRTFVMFVRYRGEDKGFPNIEYEHLAHVAVKEYLEQIPKDATQLDEYSGICEMAKLELAWAKLAAGEDYRHTSPYNSVIGIIFEKEKDLKKVIEKIEGIKETIKHIDGHSDEAKARWTKCLTHIQTKLGMNLGFYVDNVCWLKDNTWETPAVMFKQINNLMHYSSDRMISAREWLHLMGHPHDYEMYGDILANMSKIGQNVPVNTANYITRQALNIIQNWDEIERSNETPYMFSNCRLPKGMPDAYQEALEKFEESNKN